MSSKPTSEVEGKTYSKETEVRLVSEILGDQTLTIF